jgi:myosin heavy subunit
MNANAPLQQPSTLEHLKQYGGDDLLEAFLHCYNQQNADWDEMIAENARLQQLADGYKRQANTQAKEIEKLEEENASCRDMAKKAEEIANQSNGLQQELATARRQILELRNKVKELNGEGSPKKLKAQVKRLKDKDSEQKKRIASQEQVIKTLRSTLEQRGAQLNQTIDKVEQLKIQLAHDTGSGLFHKDDHHLIIWPQKTKMQDQNGNQFEGRSLLYLHQSGRGGLMTYNPETEEVNLCAAPRGGLRPSEDLKEFATNWLYKVNVLQEGVVNVEDMTPVNYNGFEG